jgi:hypothetical protein
MPRLLILAGAALCLAGCQQADERMDAAKGVQSFIVATQTGDAAAFERHIDRAALRESLKPQLLAAAGPQAPVVAKALASPRGEAIIDQAITPASFQIAAQGLGGVAKREPSPMEVAAMLKMEGEDRACVRDPRALDSCVLSFQRRDGTWKLVAVKAAGVRVAPG